MLHVSLLCFYQNIFFISTLPPLPDLEHWEKSMWWHQFAWECLGIVVMRLGSWTSTDDKWDQHFCKILTICMIRACKYPARKTTALGTLGDPSKIAGVVANFLSATGIKPSLMTFVSVMKDPDSLKVMESRSIYDVKMSMFFVVHQKPLSTLTKGLMGLFKQVCN